MTQENSAKLLAVVCFESKEDQVKCGYPGCKHYVYRRIHVVEDGGEISILGSTCFAKKYQGKEPLGTANFGHSGDGKMLTADERELLLQNTAALIARFAQEQKVQQQQDEQSRVLPPPPAVSLAVQQSSSAVAVVESPWPWQKPLSSNWYILLQDGSGWVRVQHTDGKQLLVPWPVFDGWDETLPPQVGEPSEELMGYVLKDVPAALGYLRGQRDWESKAGRWRDVLVEISKRKKGGGKDFEPRWATA